MKKTFTIFSIFMLLAVGVYAQESYNRYHINETFSAEAVPTGWFAQVTNQSNADNITNPPYGANGTFAWTGGVANLTGGGGGNRGGKLTFPTPQRNPLMNLAESLDNLYWMEMDWRVNAAAVTAKNAVGLVISDSINSTNNPRSIFGIYAVSNDGVIHVWNKDIVGPFTTEENPDLITRVFNTGNQGGGFQRAGADDATTVSRNASTATSVTYSTGAIYHITAALNFVTKTVVSITITNTNDASTVTLTNLPFIDSNAEALGNIAVCDTRGTNDGNSSTNSNINVDIDNVQVYIKVLSLGRENVTVNFLDQNNAVAKAAKVYPLQEVGQLFIVDLEEKNNFTDAGYYFAYDAANTVADRLTVQSGVQNTLTLKFKKTAETVGTYVWGGDTNSTWDYLQNNFSVSSAPAIAYQPGNDVAFSRNDVAYKEVSVAGTIDLGTANIAITAPDYKLKGDGKLVGLGKITVNAPTSLALNNQLDAGVTVNANEITVENVLAAKKLEFTQNNSTLKLNPADGKFSIPIETPESSTFNVGIYATLSNTDGANYYPAITGASTINFLLGVTGGLRSTAWNTAWTGTVPANAVVNVTNEVEDVLPNGFGIGAANMLNAKLHLGENVRLLQNYNESGTFNDAIQIGELTGAAGSYLEGGWVDGRGREWQIGSLNTDAVFDGGIRGYHKFTAATDTTPEVITSGTSAIRLT
ncbi:MAG: hypothetical protein LBV75_05275, partial [Paludibacter sp.]|nr:hypothetical protein [Paludibacter sp.]